MDYAEWSPGPDLEPFVRCIWSLRRRAAGAAPERILPDASPEIIFNFGDRFLHHREDGSVVEQPGWFVVGQIDRAMMLDAPVLADVVGVRLRPAALPALLAVPAHELTGRVVDMQDLPSSTDDAWYRAAEAAALLARIDVVRDFVRRRVRAVSRDPDPLVEDVLSRVQRTGGRVRVRDVAHDVGRSARAFERRVLQAVGLRPKTIARIVRVQRVAGLKRAAPRTPWAALALQCGYADQAHLVRDFKRIAGVTPARFFGEPTVMNDAFQDGPHAAFVQDTAHASA